MRVLTLTLAALAACQGPDDTPFTVTGVSPPSIAKVLGDKVTIRGQGLAGTASVRLVLDGESKALAAPKSAETTVEVAIPSGLATGAWDVELTDADGRIAKKAAALKVVDGEFQIEVSNIGQGDGGFIRTPDGRTLVIDGGRAKAANGADSITPVLAARGITKPEFLLATHFDADHLGGLVDWMQGPDGKACTTDDRYPQEGLVDYALKLNTCASDLCAEYYDLRECHGSQMSGIGWHVPGPGEFIPLGAGAKVKVVAVNGLTESDEIPTGSDNSNSIALLIEYGRFRYLTAGDLTGGKSAGCNVGPDTADVETAVGNAVGRVEVLHVDHHGSCTSSNPAFLAKVSPQVSVISVGEDNSYGHPAQDVIDRLDGTGTKMFLTSGGIVSAGQGFAKTKLPASADARHGHIRIVTTDGETYKVTIIAGASQVLGETTFRTRR